MAIRSAKKIYELLEQHLREAKEPVTCNSLMELPEIYEVAMKELGGDKPNKARVTEKLSDTLGFMWRRGLLKKFPAPRTSTSFARFSYSWDPAYDQRSDIKASTTIPAQIVTRKTGFNITETDDGITVEFEKFIVTIKPK